MPRPGRKLSDNIVPLAPQSNRPPSHLEAQEQELWKRITRVYVIDDPGALEVLDTALQARGRMRRCREAIDKDGEVIRDRWNVARAHPVLVAERGTRNSYLKALRLLNLDLAGQAR